MTNEERIKSLSTGELADEIFKVTTDCAYCPIEDLCNEQRIKKCES